MIATPTFKYIAEVDIYFNYNRQLDEVSLPSFLMQLSSVFGFEKIYQSFLHEYLLYHNMITSVQEAEEWIQFGIINGANMENVLKYIWDFSPSNTIAGLLMFVTALITKHPDWQLLDWLVLNVFRLNCNEDYSVLQYLLDLQPDTNHYHVLKRLSNSLSVSFMQSNHFKMQKSLLTLISLLHKENNTNLDCLIFINWNDPSDFVMALRKAEHFEVRDRRFINVLTRLSHRCTDQALLEMITEIISIKKQLEVLILVSLKLKQKKLLKALSNYCQLNTISFNSSFKKQARSVCHVNDLLNLFDYSNSKAAARKLNHEILEQW